MSSPWIQSVNKAQIGHLCSLLGNPKYPNKAILGWLASHLRETVRSEKPAVVCVYLFQLQTHTSQEKPFIRLNTVIWLESKFSEIFFFVCMPTAIKIKPL